MALKAYPDKIYGSCKIADSAGIIKIRNVKRGFNKDSELEEDWVELYNDDVGIEVYTDYTCEYGEKYYYKVNDIIVNPSSANNTYFEDAILYDASVVSAIGGDAAQEKPQVIRFNQNISSLKINQADSVTQTLGSRYPIIRRSGHVNYKSFTIGGLISVLANTQNYNGDRTLLERKFRDDFLDILGNGNVKLFKSGPEGNMIIRITGGITLTPETALGRDIYSFSAQATEVAAPTPENLRALGFFDPTKFLTVQQTSSTDNDVFFTVGE